MVCGCFKSKKNAECVNYMELDCTHLVLSLIIAI